jgi:hypothetical protein
MDDRTKAVDSAVRSFASVWQVATAAYDAGKEAGLAAAAVRLAPVAPEPADPMDTPLPCDVTVGHGTHRKGTRLGSLVARMKMLHEAAFGPAPTPEAAARNLAILQGAAPEPAAALTDAKDAARMAERERWSSACHSIANDLRHHEMVRLGAAKCMDAALRAPQPKEQT